MTYLDTFDVQKAIFAVLAADAAVTAVVSTRIYDIVPDGTAYPYISIRWNPENPWDDKSCRGKELTMMVNCWMRVPGGTKALQGLMSAVWNCLNKKRFSNTATSQILFCLFDYGNSGLSPDGRTLHGVQRFRMLTNEL